MIKKSSVIFLILLNMAMPSFSKKVVNKTPKPRNLSYSVQFARHGARASTYPDYIEKFALSGESVQPREVTDWGLESHFRIGREFILPHYGTFLGTPRENIGQIDLSAQHMNATVLARSPFIPEDNYYQTSSTSRTFQSAMAQLAGTYGLEGHLGYPNFEEFPKAPFE